MPSRDEKNKLLGLDPNAIALPWRDRPGNSYGFDRRYRAKLDAINNGTTGDDFFFFSGEMVRYLIEKQGISEKEFNDILGFGKNYFRGNIFNHAWNNGASVLPEPFRKRMAELTRESLKKKGIVPEEFWCKRNFTLSDVDGLFIDATRDISDAQVQYPKREPNEETQTILDRIPELAKTLLIIPATETTPSQWRRDTFLINAAGKFSPIMAMPSIRYLVENPNYTPEQIIDALTKRTPDEPYFHDKGVFMKAVLKAAKDEHLIPAFTEASRFIPLRPINRNAWSR